MRCLIRLQENRNCLNNMIFYRWRRSKRKSRRCRKCWRIIEDSCRPPVSAVTVWLRRLLSPSPLSSNVIYQSSTIYIPSTTTCSSYYRTNTTTTKWLNRWTSFVSTNQDWTSLILIQSGSNPGPVVTLIKSDPDQLWLNLSFLWSWQKPPQPASASSTLATVPRTALLHTWEDNRGRAVTNLS